MNKLCSVCKTKKSINDFNQRPDRLSGYRSECKKCQYKRQGKQKRPEYRFSAYNKFHYAKKKNKVLPPMFCELCGEVKPLEAHHDDYNKPLAVKWICAKCHRSLQKKAI